MLEPSRPDPGFDPRSGHMKSLKMVLAALYWAFGIRSRARTGRLGVRITSPDGVYCQVYGARHISSIHRRGMTKLVESDEKNQHAHSLVRNWMVLLEKLRYQLEVQLNLLWSCIWNLILFIFALTAAHKMLYRSHGKYHMIFLPAFGSECYVF